MQYNAIIILSLAKYLCVTPGSMVWFCLFDLTAILHRTHSATFITSVCLQRVCMFAWASSCIGNVFTVRLRVCTYTVSPCIKSSGRSFSMFPRIHASSCFMSPVRVPQRSKVTGQSSASQPHGRCDATELRMQGGGRFEGGTSRIGSPTVIFEHAIENIAVMLFKFRFVNAIDCSRISLKAPTR